MRELPKELLRIPVALVLLCLTACGGDDDARMEVEADGEEGWPCLEAGECAAELACVGSPILIDDRPIGVCGLPCAGPDDCDGRCLTYTGDAEDGHCADVVEEEFALCGVADTSICAADMVCLYLPGEFVGVCVTLCALDGSGAAGGDEDAGAPALGACSAGQTCLDSVLANPDPNEGVCGTVVERGEECGIDLGLFCESGSVCALEDPRDPASAQRCVAE